MRTCVQSADRRIGKYHASDTKATGRMNTFMLLRYCASLPVLLALRADSRRINVMIMYKWPMKSENVCENDCQRNVVVSSCQVAD